MELEQAKQLIGDLGTTPEEVACTLRAQGITGCHGSRTCPVANYLIRHGADDCIVGNVQVYPNGSSDFFFLPYPVREFINGFDSDRYPDLVAP